MVLMMMVVSEGGSWVGWVKRDQAGDRRRVKRRGKEEGEVKKAKATPDLVAAAEEKRNSMTVVKWENLYFRRPAGSGGGGCLLAVKSEPLNCIVPQREMLAVRWTTGRQPNVKDDPAVDSVGM